MEHHQFYSHKTSGGMLVRWITNTRKSWCGLVCNTPDACGISKNEWWKKFLHNKEIKKLFENNS